MSTRDDGRMARVLHQPLRIGGTTVRNRLYRAPVLEGAGDSDDAAEAYSRHFVDNARHGVGLIIQGSSCIWPEGRTSPGMTCVDTREKVMRLAPMVDAVQEAGASIFLQLGHGGIYAMEAWHEPYATHRAGPLLAASPLPWLLRPTFRGVPIHVMTTDEVKAMAVRYGDIAAWAREAGYDGIQLGSANAKLLDQFLSPFYNRRTDEFGGSFDRLDRLLEVIREQVAPRAAADYTCTVKVPIGEKAPPFTPHTTWDEGIRLAVRCEEMGYDSVTPVEVSVFPDTTLSRGGIPKSLWENQSMKARFTTAAPRRFERAVLRAGYVFGGLTAPFKPVWNRSRFVAVKQRVSIPVLAVGGIRTKEEVDAILDGGEADLVGIGRPFYAEADVAARMLGDRGSGASDGAVLCRSSNQCVPAQMPGMKGVCYNPEVVRLRRRGA